jgi:hypothetical protein
MANSEWRVANSAILLLAMEEMPILSAEERKKLLSSLEQAQLRVKSGEAIIYDTTSLKERLIRIYREGKR